MTFSRDGNESVSRPRFSARTQRVPAASPRILCDRTSWKSPAACPPARQVESAHAVESWWYPARRGAARPSSFSRNQGSDSFSSYTLRSCERYASCERGDSNPHGLLHWILSPARLPNSATSALAIEDSHQFEPHQSFSGESGAKNKNPRRTARGFSMRPARLNYFSTCRFTTLGACVFSAS
jgi:hypothetical protein